MSKPSHFQDCTCFDCIDNKLAEQKAQLEQSRHAFNLLQHNFTEQQRVNNEAMNKMWEGRQAQVEKLEVDRDLWKKSAEGVASHHVEHSNLQEQRIDALQIEVAKLEAELKEAERLLSNAHYPYESEQIERCRQWLERRKARP